MKIPKDNRMDFMIVRKEGSMRTVGQDCDGLAQVCELPLCGAGRSLTDSTLQVESDRNFLCS